MLTGILRGGLVLAGVMVGALFSAVGFGAASGMTLFCCAWLMVRPLREIAVWMVVILAIGLLLHTKADSLALFAGVVAVYGFDAICRYLARTNTRSRAVTGSIAVVLVVAVSYGAGVFAVSESAFSFAAVVTRAAYAAVGMMIVEGVIRRAERFAALYAYGDDVRRHI